MGLETIEICFVSKYDGEKYLNKDCTSVEFKNLENLKRKKLQKEGIDVDKYDKIHEHLTKEYLNKYPKMKNTFERANLYEEYEQKKKDLAKEFFGIELENVVMY